MSFILQIDTSSAQAGVSLSHNGNGIILLTNDDHREHAAFVQPAIQEICKKTAIQLKDIAAVAVVNGPGSYTGIRVGLASAKGICYALDKPLITINNLELMARAMQLIHHEKEETFFCPLIDARRMEVFTAIYDHDLQCITAPSAVVIDDSFHAVTLEKQPILFFGSGAEKLKPLVSSDHAFFTEETDSYHALCKFSYEKYLLNQFANLAYTEPFYLKAFYTGS